MELASLPADTVVFAKNAEGSQSSSERGPVCSGLRQACLYPLASPSPSVARGEVASETRTFKIGKVW